jgi:hypothetical protein
VLPGAESGRPHGEPPWTRQRERGPARIDQRHPPADPLTPPAREGPALQRLRLLSGLSIAGTLVVAIALIADLARYRSDREARSLALGREAGVRVAEALDAELSAISLRAEAFVEEVSPIESEALLLEKIRSASLELPLVLGVTVAYEPGAFPGKQRYAPFFNKRRNEFQFVEQSYDYTDPELETARWYTRIVESGEPAWSAPYYAEAAQTMVVDYGVPIRAEDGEVRGIVDYAITLHAFTEIVDSLSVGEAGYGFTFDRDGAILAHPDPKYLMETVFRLRDGKTEAILAKLRNEPEGVVEYQSTYTYRLSSFFFRALASTSWKSVLVYTEDDLLGASDEGRRKTIHVALGVGAFLVSLMVFPFGSTRYSTRRLWWIVAGTSTVIVGNIVLLWVLNVSTDFSKLDGDRERIVNPTVLGRYADAYDRDLQVLAQAHHRRVPTGIYIESYEQTPFEAKVIGRLWMKYPKALYEVAEPAFYFPGVSAVESRGFTSELLSEVDQGDYVLLTWRFRATLEQEFSYQQFPFEQNDIQVTVMHPEIARHILLVPDLESYEVLNPDAKPGLNPNVTAPSSETISTFFTFEEIDYRSSFGSREILAVQPALTFNMAVKRIWLSPFIANIIPILIVALILFIVLYVSSNRDDPRSGLTTMNVIQSSAGFLFILLLAHVNERGRIETPEIAYIELFYFSMYVLITLQTVILAVTIGGAGGRLLGSGDNRVLKLAFWPTLLSIWLAVTLVRFY